MSALVQAFQQYFEFLILGGLALALWGIVFRVSVVKEWRRVFSKFMLEQAPTAEEVADAKQPANATVYVALEWGIPFAVCYVLGFMLNIMAYSVLQWAHIEVICSVSQYLDGAPAKFELDPEPRFFLLPIRMVDRPPVKCATAYRKDNKRQVDWQINHGKSYDEAVDALIKQMRLVRGFVILSMLFAGLGTLRFLYDVFSRGRARHGQIPTSLLVLVRRWLLLSTVLISVYVLAMLMYWNVEGNFHEQVYASEPLGPT